MIYFRNEIMINAHDSVQSQPQNFRWTWLFEGVYITSCLLFSVILFSKLFAETRKMLSSITLVMLCLTHVIEVKEQVSRSEVHTMDPHT